MIQPFRTDDQYMSISNDLIDYIMPRLKPNAWKVLCFIVRKTHGWHKERDALSYSQIVKGTGIGSSATISAALKELETDDLIIREHGDKWDSVAYRLNLDYEIVTTDAILASETKAKKRKKTASKTEVASKTEAEPASETKLTPLQKLKTQKTEDIIKDMSATRSRARIPRAAKAKDENQNAPAVLAYYEVTGIRPNKVQADLIAHQVDDLSRWRETVTLWMAAGWNKTSVDKMLDRYQKTQKAQMNGHAPDDKYAALRKIEAMEREYERQMQQEGGAS